VGSARLLQHAGAVALATTSSGLAASLGRHDQHVGHDELIAHVAAICAAVTIPVNVDAERCYADEAAGIAPVVEALADAGAAGLSIEDYDPSTQAIDPIDVATERVFAAAEAAHRRGLVLTARAENHLYGNGDLADTLERLAAYRDAGADCLYAPGLVAAEDIVAVVALGRPVNVLLRPGGPTVPELAELGVRRVSTGGRLAFVAYGALMAAARELLDAGTLSAPTLSGRDRAAFG
jgi:2-methylisocitrate lyase-like PEP mutase family enzyme